MLKVKSESAGKTEKGEREGKRKAEEKKNGTGREGVNDEG